MVSDAGDGDDEQEQGRSKKQKLDGQMVGSQGAFFRVKQRVVIARPSRSVAELIRQACNVNTNKAGGSTEFRSLLYKAMQLSSHDEPFVAKVAKILASLFKGNAAGQTKKLLEGLVQ